MLVSKGTAIVGARVPMLFFKDEVSYTLPKLKRERSLWQLFLLWQGCLQWLKKKQLHQDISFRIKIGEKLNNSPISGRTGYDLTQKSKGQQTFGKTHYFTTTDCCPNVYRNPIRATSNEICFWGRPLQKCVLLCKHLIKKEKRQRKSHRFKTETEVRVLRPLSS